MSKDAVEEKSNAISVANAIPEEVVECVEEVAIPENTASENMPKTNIDVNEFIDMKYTRRSNADRAMRVGQKGVMQRYAEYRAERPSIKNPSVIDCEPEDVGDVHIYHCLKAELEDGNVPSEIVEQDVLARLASKLGLDVLSSDRLTADEKVAELKKMVEAMDNCR